jgi:hypothetical protein
MLFVQPDSTFGAVEEIAAGAAVGAEEVTLRTLHITNMAS